MRHTYIAIASTSIVLLAACGTSPTGQFVQTLNVVLSEETQPISDVEGPFGAVSMKKHAVAVRVWPNGLDDGVADVSIIVTNGGWNTILLSKDDISLQSASGEIAVLGRADMLARLEDPSGTAAVAAGGVAAVGERQSTQAQGGAMVGSRRSGDVAGSMMDPAIADAARRADATRQPSTPELGDATIEERRTAIESWYLDRIEIYPGDSGTGGVSFALPSTSQNFELLVALDGETYSFDLQYLRE